MMGLFTRLARVRSSFRGATPARLLALIATGTLGQRVTFTLGVGVIFFALFQSLPWVALALFGGALCWLALRDFVRMHEK
jgi:hypothetical protein